MTNGAPSSSSLPRPRCSRAKEPSPLTGSFQQLPMLGHSRALDQG
jgi:hypothetical protein